MKYKNYNPQNDRATKQLSNFRIKLAMRLLVLLVVMMFFVGCSSNTVYIGRRNWIRRMARSSLTTGDISYISTQFLVSNALMDKFRDAPDKVIKLLAEEVEKPAGKFLSLNDNTRDVLGVLIDLCMCQAQNSDEDVAIKYWVACSYYSFRFLFDTTILPDPLPSYALGTAAALRYYNISSSEVFSYIKDNNMSFYSKPEFNSILKKVKFSYPKSDLLQKVDAFDRFVVTYDYLPTEFEIHTFSPGIGVPIIGLNNSNKNINFSDREMLIDKIYPFTFMINYELGSKGTTINAAPGIFDSFKDEFIKMGGLKIPLAKDFTVALAELMNTEQRIDGIEFVFNPGSMGKLEGLYLLSPYDPNKIPVVLVHGLFGVPRDTWDAILNTLLSNRIIRQNYQFWIYTYPSGLPLFATASDFRKHMIEAQRKYDPEGKNEKFNKMILIGYSMGGIIVRLAVQDSEGTKFVDEMIKEVSNKKLDQLELSAKAKQTVKDYLVFKPLPFVSSVIFMVTPHRGSDMALAFYSRIGTWLVDIPKQLLDKTISFTKDIFLKKGTPSKIEEFDLEETPTGIASLSPKNIYLVKSNGLKFGKNVKLHSIIGDNEKAGQKGGTDGIVPYSSSHMDGVQSEYILQSDHYPQKNQLAIKEIARILQEYIPEK